jgi:hypothetical protein
VSTLLADFFVPNVPISQKFKIKSSLDIHSIRVHLYKTNLLTDGTVTIELIDEGVVLDTVSYDYNYLNLTMGNSYTHGFITCMRDIRIGGRQSGELEHEYEIKATFTGQENTLAWIMEYENQLNEVYGGFQDNDAYNPKDIEIWIYK